MATSRLRRWLRDGAAERHQLAGRGLRLHSEAAGRAALRGTFDFRHRRLRPERHEVDSTEHAGDRPANRSEEHTSELQSLMRSTYAVFRLNKKNKSKDANNTVQQHTRTYTV